MIGLRIGTAGGVDAGVAVGPARDMDDPPIAASNTTLTGTFTDSADPLAAGGTLTYTLAVHNAGAVAAIDVEAIVQLDPSLTYVSSAGTGWTIARAGNEIICELASLASGADANNITVTTKAGTTPATVASVVEVACGNAPDINISQSTAITGSIATPTFAASAASVSALGAYSYTFDIFVSGATALSQPVIAIVLPLGSAYVSASGSGWTVTQTAGVVVASRATLAVGAAPQLVVNVTARATLGTATATATLSAGNVSGVSLSQGIQVTL